MLAMSGSSVLRALLCGDCVAINLDLQGPQFMRSESLSLRRKTILAFPSGGSNP